MFEIPRCWVWTLDVSFSSLIHRLLQPLEPRSVGFDDGISIDSLPAWDKGSCERAQCWDRTRSSVEVHCVQMNVCLVTRHMRGAALRWPIWNICSLERCLFDSLGLISQFSPNSARIEGSKAAAAISVHVLAGVIHRKFRMDDFSQHSNNVESLIATEIA